VVEHRTLNPGIGGSNPAPGAGRENLTEIVRYFLDIGFDGKTLRACTIKVFTVVILCGTEVSCCVNHFQPSLTFVVKAGAYFSRRPKH